VPSAKKKISFGTLRCFARDGTRTIVSGAASRAQVLCQHRQTRSRSRAMSGGAAFVSSSAQDDDSDRGEDQDDVPSFVVAVTIRKKQPKFSYPKRYEIDP
jgi:hypothetical protein